MKIDNLKNVLEKEPGYRLKQAQSAVFQGLISDWNEATIFPLALRKILNEQCPIFIKAEFVVSKKEDAIKAKIELKDGLFIESALMKHRDGRNTVCVSSQVGCSLGCQFCATGQMGFKRNLEPMEIVEQVLFFNRFLKKQGSSRSEGSYFFSRFLKRPVSVKTVAGRVTNVVFMGMGEPFLNYQNVIAAIRVLNDKNGLNIGARSISVSTAGVIEGIKKLSSENIQINLAISLHAVNNEMRDKIMPVNEKYSMEDMFKATDEYIKKTKRQVMFEYLLIKDFNDSDECAFELAKLMKKQLRFLNLILYNQTGIFKPSSPERVKKFKSILEGRGINFSQRYRFGEDIDAACGQFAIGATIE